MSGPFTGDRPNYLTASPTFTDRPLTAIAMQEPPVAPVYTPQVYGAALQVSQGLQAKLEDAKARLLAARAGAGDAAESYLEAADALLASQERFGRGECSDAEVVSSVNLIGRAERDLRACVERMQAEEKILERAEAELQAAADAAERLL